jgi:hypothetical protein
MILPIHIAAGVLAIPLGFLALAVKKGGTTHRRIGLVFVWTMFVLGITAAILGNMGGGLMAVYFVGTAWVTVRQMTFTTAPVRALPILLVFGAMFYWLWRVRRRTLPVLLQHDSMPLTTRPR